ncbi:MAG: hypothetical protein KatS3mg093_041 [Candidatus Parcubacteria bacterium]|nr:MAG: hypothetical protein KatS3mg093_041 [Candidatus Parcubacteria bacterium]
MKLKPKSKGQLLIEIVLNLALLVVILGVVITFLIVFLNSQRYSGFNQAVAISGFEKYRNVLISLAQSNWDLFDSLVSTTNYYLYASGGQWLIATGLENITSFNETYSFYFQIDNYSTTAIKFITTTAVYGSTTLSDYFLLPKINFATE